MTCENGCQYGKDVGMPDHTCDGKFCDHYANEFMDTVKPHVHSIKHAGDGLFEVTPIKPIMSIDMEFAGCSLCGCKGIHACIGYPVVWTEEDKERLNKALGEAFGWNKEI